VHPLFLGRHFLGHLPCQVTSRTVAVSPGQTWILKGSAVVAISVRRRGVGSDNGAGRRLHFAHLKSNLLDLGSPFARKANVVTYDRHVLFASDNPADATRHRASGLISTTRIDEAFVHEAPKQLVGFIFAQADLVAYTCDLGVGVYLVPSALALVDCPEHRSALVVGKLCRHYAPLPLVPFPTVRLPDRTAICPPRTASSQATLLRDELHLHSTLGI
jgi:hypothetical protein